MKFTSSLSSEVLKICGIVCLHRELFTDGNQLLLLVLSDDLCCQQGTTCWLCVCVCVCACWLGWGRGRGQRITVWHALPKLCHCHQIKCSWQFLHCMSATRLRKHCSFLCADVRASKWESNFLGFDASISTVRQKPRRSYLLCFCYRAYDFHENMYVHFGMIYFAFLAQVVLTDIHIQQRLGKN